MRKTKKQQWIEENGPGILRLLTTEQLRAALEEYRAEAELYEIEMTVAEYDVADHELMEAEQCISQ